LARPADLTLLILLRFLSDGGIARIETLPKSDRNAKALTADVVAIKAVIGHVLGRIHQLDPILADAIEAGFEDAAGEIRALGIRARKGTGANQVVRAIATIELLHAAMLDGRQSWIRVHPGGANDNS
jgi:hypothetical protein